MARLSVFGLGKLGAPLAAVLASKGHEVIGVDIDSSAVAAVNAGRAPVRETDLQNCIGRAAGRLSASGDGEAAVLRSDISFVIVPTPTDAGGRFSTRFTDAVAQSIGTALTKKKPTRHVVVLTSTVMPQYTVERFIPILETCSGMTCGRDFGVCYNPEFIALGTAIRDMLRPDFILIGESDSCSGDALAGIYRQICENNPAILRMNILNAELTKLAVNNYVTTKISFANTVAQICEQIPGADADVVLRAIGFDSRIGRKYLTGAVSYGGPCFPRDNRAFRAMARRLGVAPVLAEATEAVNEWQVNLLVRMAIESCPSPTGSITVLGLSYKPNTSVADASAGIEIANRLARRGFNLTVYDPGAMEEADKMIDRSVVRAASLSAAVANADTIVIVTAWNDFKDLARLDLKSGAERPVIVDCWRILDRASIEGKARIVWVGAGRRDGTPQRPGVAVE
jgi:UDPglucose 6-dehydrogenase